MNACPYIYILPFSGMDGNDIIKGILEENAGPEFEGEFNIYNWTINNKYYIADIRLCVVEDIRKCPIHMNTAAEALLVYFDPKQTNVLNDIDQLANFELDDTNADVKILVCKSYEDFSLLTKEEVLNWCISNGWEMVELNPEDELSDDELEDDFADSFGFERIKQALNANTWSNLKMKDAETSIMSNLLQNLDLDSTDEPSYQQLDDEDSWTDNVDTLFSNLSEIKTKAASLPFEERKEYAAKVAMQFLKALGDDEDNSDAEV